MNYIESGMLCLSLIVTISNFRILILHYTVHTLFIYLFIYFKNLKSFTIL
jgi:hypothetical protein